MPAERPARRDLLAGAGGLVVGTGLGTAATAGPVDTGTTPTPGTPAPGASPTHAPPPATPAPAPGVAAGRVPFHGPVQAGITRPEVPQARLHLMVLDRASDVPAARLWRAVGAAAKSLVGGPLGGLATSDLTVTVGVGRADALAAYPDLEWREDLPVFAREQLGNSYGGDLAIQLCAGEPGVVTEAAVRMLAAVADMATVRWRQDASRGTQDERGVSRSPIGFHTGIALPRTPNAQERGVWIAPPEADDPLAGASFMIVRRLRMDMASWAGRSRREQEEAVGRDKQTGAPLSGGSQQAPADLAAEDQDGVWKIPPNAHIRRAHPSAIRRPAMWRRSYGYTNTGSGFGSDEGVLFICFVSAVSAFVLTQRRLDEADDLLSLATATASGAFLILPGLSPGENWG